MKFISSLCMSMKTKIVMPNNLSENSLTSAMKNSSVNSNEMFFKELDEPRLSKTIFIVMSVILSLLCIVGFFGIIWFERFDSDLKRVCINRIISSLSWTDIFWFTVVQPIDIFLYFYRPIPELFCFCHLLLKNILALQGMLFYDSIIIVRFILIFCLKSPINFQDDFWYCFINISIANFRLLA